MKLKKLINPFGLHPNSRKKKQRQGQYTIPLAMAQLHQNEAQCTALIPGQKLCKDCWHKSKSLQKQTEMSSCSESADSTCSEDSELDQNFQDYSIILVDTSLTSCGVSPFKSKGKTSKQKEIHAQKKVSQAAKKLNAAFKSSGINVACSSQAVISEKSMAETDMNQMMTELKQKFSKSNS